jgi:hypothetical protein
MYCLKAGPYAASGTRLSCLLRTTRVWLGAPGAGPIFAPLMFSKTLPSWRFGRLCLFTQQTPWQVAKFKTLLLRPMNGSSLI